MRTTNRALPNTSWVMLLVDFRNAFNTVDRSSILSNALKKPPRHTSAVLALMRPVASAWCARGRTSAWSSAGASRRGCAGPPGFCSVRGWTTHLTSAVPRSRTRSWKSWYLDDGVIVGHFRRCATTSRSCTQQPKNDLHLNLLKCTLWGRAAPPPGLAPSVPRDTPGQPDPGPSPLPRFPRAPGSPCWDTHCAWRSIMRTKSGFP
jgi:hypothetical protein